MDKIFKMQASKILGLLYAKVERKGKTKDDVEVLITWLLGYQKDDIAKILESEMTYEDFFKEAPKVNDDYLNVTGSICKVKIEAIEDETYRKMRVLDKLVDELAKGKSSDVIISKYTKDH